MTVNKLTYPAKENAVQEKINEIIDNLGGSTTEIFVATYGTTTFSDVLAAYNAGKTIYAKRTISPISSVNDYYYYALIRYQDLSIQDTFYFANCTGKIIYTVSLTDDDTWSIASNTLIANTDKATSSTLGIVQPDNSTITVDANGVITTEGVINQQDNVTTLKYWTGTKAQYNAITTKDSNTLYNITDDTVNLNNVANTDLSNITDTGKITIAHNAMPSNTYDNLTLGASGTTYTAPADGWLTIHFLADNGNTFFNLYCNNNEYALTLHSGNQVGYNQAGTVPMRKGTNVEFSYNGSPTVFYLRFIYAVGSESEAS